RPWLLLSLLVSSRFTLFFFDSSAAPPDLHSFPTRRSSDLTNPARSSPLRTSPHTQAAPPWKMYVVTCCPHCWRPPPASRRTWPRCPVVAPTADHRSGAAGPMDS